MHFPIECHDPANGTTRTVYVVRTWMGERDEEFMADRLGNVYRRRGQGRLGVVLHSEAEVEPLPAPTPSAQRVPDRKPGDPSIKAFPGPGY